MRYFKLLLILSRYSLLRELEYRVNFVTNVVMSFCWMIWAILSTTILFQFRPQIGDWSYYEVLIVIALFFIFTGVMEAFFRPNLTAIVKQIRDGTFDFVLQKPINSQFYASLRSLVIWRLFDIGAGVVIIAYALGQLDLAPTPGQVLVFVVMVGLAVVILYSIWLMMATLAFWFIKIDNMPELFFAFYEAGRFPVSIFRGWLRAFFTFVIPLAFVTTVPASALLGQLETSLLPVGFIFAVGLFIVSNRLWNVAIRSYSSASS